MRIGFYTSSHYFDAKREAVDEAAKRLGIEADILSDPTFNAMVSREQTFGLEDLLKKTKKYAAQAVIGQNADVGIGVENALAFIYAANEWYYVICVALQTKDGASTASFTPGISIPHWMIKDVQDENIKIDALTQRFAGVDDPVIYFSQKLLTRKDLMVPPLLLAFANLGISGQTEK